MLKIKEEPSRYDILLSTTGDASRPSNSSKHMLQLVNPPRGPLIAAAAIPSTSPIFPEKIHRFLTAIVGSGELLGLTNWAQFVLFVCTVLYCVYRLLGVLHSTPWAGELQCLVWHNSRASWASCRDEVQQKLKE